METSKGGDRITEIQLNILTLFGERPIGNQFMLVIGSVDLMRGISHE
jgi:hypothetical protein